jgi:hypothetical protein
MLNSVTGGSTALSVVFGWSVVVKYVPAPSAANLVLTNTLKTVCLTYQVKSFANTITHCIVV